MRFSRVSRVWRALAAVVLIEVTGGCTSGPVLIDPIVVTESPTRKVGKSIAFFHDKSFAETQRTIEPLGNQWYLPLKVGDASDRALRAAYPRIFESVKEVASRNALANGSAVNAPSALLEPKEVRLDYLEATGRGWGPYYSAVRLRFSLADAAGASIADWHVHGFAQFDPSYESGPRGEPEKYVEAPRRAIEAAARNFVRSFDRVPELVRWSRNLPAGASGASSSTQLIAAGNSTHAGAEIRHPGVLMLQVNRAQLPRIPSEPSVEQATVPPLIAVHLTLRNESSRRLLLDPAHIEWVAPGGATLLPLPAPIVPALLSGRTFGMAGTSGVPGLFVALATAASLGAHKQRLAMWSLAIERDTFTDTEVPPRATHTGIVYFAQPSNRTDGELVMHVIDLDDAIRYTIRVPLPVT